MEDVALISDQVFQLNTLLWALEELPETGQISPVLKQAGYYLDSIGRRLLAPIDDSILTALRTLTGTDPRTPCRPDLWINSSTDGLVLLIELKSRGFSPTSSNRRQALKLMASAFDVASSLGESTERRGHVVYGSVKPDGVQLSETLKSLAQQLSSRGVPAASTGVIGFSIEDDGIAISSPDPSNLPAPAETALSDAAIVIHKDGTNSLQPLYFIPWIPDIDTSQDPKLRSDGFRELTARILVHTLSEVAQANVPTTLTISGSRLLSRATFGIFDYWREQNRADFSEAAAKIVERALKPSVTIRRQNEHLEINIPDTQAQDMVIRELERAKPEDSTSNLEATIDEPPTLFEQVDD